MANMLMNTVNFLISGLGSILTTIMGVLPNTPFSALSNSGVSQWLGGLAWIVPINGMLAIGEAWLTAIVVYYGYQVVMRWVKVVA